MTAAQKSELRVAVRSNFVAPSPAAGNGIFGCRDRAPKSPLKCANVGRDQNPRSEWPEIPAETPYWESYRKRAVCEDWMVVCAVMCEPVSGLISALLQGIFSNCCLLSENAPRFAALVQWLTSEFPKGRNRPLLALYQGAIFQKQGQISSEQAADAAAPNA